MILLIQQMVSAIFKKLHAVATHLKAEMPSFRDIHIPHMLLFCSNAGNSSALSDEFQQNSSTWSKTFL